MLIAEAENPTLIMQYNLEKELNLQRTFDMIWSYEFVEHIHLSHVHSLMKTFSNHANVVVMSAAKSGQGGEGHFNEQPDSYWIEKFQQYGFSLNHENTEILRNVDELFAQNMMVFERLVLG